MQTNTLIGIVVVLAIVLVGGFFLLGADTPAENEEAAGNTLTEENRFANEDNETGSSNSANSGDNENASASNDTSASDETTSTVTTVTYGSTGFSPSSVTVRAGDTVRFVNESGASMWVASDEHPTHTQYAGTTRSEHCAGSANTAFDQCESGNTYSFTFEKAGSWNYHNHVQASHGGTIVVE